MKMIKIALFPRTKRNHMYISVCWNEWLMWAPKYHAEFHAIPQHEESTNSLKIEC